MSYVVTDLPMIVKSENPTGGRSWVFTLVGHKDFHVKILVFLISAVFVYCFVKISQ